MPKWKSLQLYLPIIFSSLVVFLLPAAVITRLVFKTPSPSQENVLGMSGGSGGREASISVSAEQYLPSGGVIALTSVEEPVIKIEGHGVNGNATATLYAASLSDILSYLTHDKDNKQLYPNPDVSSREVITSQSFDISTESRLNLPLQPVGIYLVKIDAGSVTTYAYIIRSNAGVIVKNSSNQLVFWGQNHGTHRSLTAGTITLYNLQGGSNELEKANLNEQGIAVLNTINNVDIAIYQNESDISIIPVNLTYINSGYSWTRFATKTSVGKYFMFTDRPLYRPGDTVYFKAVVRDDDDARYTVPQGLVHVKIYQGWGEDEEILYEKDHPLNEYGGVDGKVELPKDGNLGDYIISMRKAPESENSWENQTYFQVQHFRKPEYTLEVDAKEMEAVSGDNLEFTLKGEYLFGAPLANQEVEYTLTAAPIGELDYLQSGASPQIDEEQYFGSYYYGDTISQGTVTLDEQGTATITLPTVGSVDGQNRIFSLEATLKDNSGNPTFDRKNVLVYAGLWSLYRTDQFMRYRAGEQINIPIQLTSHQPTSRETTININAIRSEWVKKPNPQSKYDTYEQQTESLSGFTAKTNKDGNGTITFTPEKPGSYTLTTVGIDSRGNTIKKDLYMWVTLDEAIVYFSGDNQGITITSDKATYEAEEVPKLTLQSTIPNTDLLLSVERGYMRRYQVVSLNGNQGEISFPLEITDMPNIYLGLSTFANNYLAKASQKIIVSPERRHMGITLKTDKETYSPGETVSVDVTTTDRFGNGLPAEVTLWTIDKALFELVEAGPKDIFEKFWQERYNYTETGHSLEGIIALAAEGGGGCFTADTPITLANGTTKPISEITVDEKILTLASPTKLEAVPARVSKVLKHKVDGLLVINNALMTTPNHRLLVNGVWATAGSIQKGDFLTGQSGESIVVTDIFWQQGEHTVYNLEVDDYHTYIANGVYVHNQKGDVRQIFKEVPYWNPSVRTDESGHASVRFTVPDNLTTWVIAAIGVDEETTVGRETADIVVSKKAVVRPTLPNLLRTGDKLTFTATGHNFSDKNRKLETTLEFEGVEIKSNKTIKQTIDSKQSAVFDWEIIPKQAHDQAPFTVSFKDPTDPEFVDIVKQTIPIKDFGFLEKQSVSAVGNNVFTLDIPKDTDKTKSTATLSVSSTVLGPVIKGMEYLIGYPYGCTEQTVSRMIPGILVSQYRQVFPNLLKDQPIDMYIAESLEHLEELQQYSGGWGWWKEGPPQHFITAFTVEALALAKKQGYPVNANMLNFAKNYFTSAATGPDGAMLTSTEEVARAYGLSFVSPKDTPQLTNLEALSDDILAMAVIAHLNKGITDPKINGLSLLISRAQHQAEAAYWQAGDKKQYGSVEASTALALRALMMANVEPELTSAGVRYLVRNRNNGFWANTFATNQVMRALLEYARKNQELNTDMNFSVIVNNKTLQNGVFKGFDPNPQTISLNLDSLPENSQIEIKTEGTGQLYGTFESSLWRTDKSIKAAGNGIHIERKYLDPHANKKLKLGDIVVVELTIDGLNAAEHYGVIRDYLPAGLIPINREFLNEQSWREVAKDYQNTYEYAYLEPELDGGTMQLFELKPGKNKYYYEARIIAKGVFAAPPARAELMYDPQVSATSGVQQLKIGDKLEGPVGELQGEKISDLALLRKKLMYIAAAVLFASICIAFAIAIKKKQPKKIHETTPPPETPSASI